MIKLSYELKVTPYVIQKVFGGLETKTTRKEVLEIDVSTLSVEQGALLNAAGGIGFEWALSSYSAQSGIVSSTKLVFDHILTLDEALDAWALDAKQYQDVQQVAEAQRKTAQLQNKAEAEQRAAARAEREAQAARDHAAAIAAAAQLHFDANGQAILNLYERLALLAGVEMDARFSNWIKRVTAVDLTKSNGYSFIGEWIPDQTVEISRQNAVYLFAATNGSRKYARTHYIVLVQRGDRIEKTDLYASSDDSGWALLLRDPIAALLESF